LHNQEKAIMRIHKNTIISTGVRIAKEKLKLQAGVL
jgi:hypothetical protein